MLLSKNAIGNLINRYKAVLKKCNLINTFGSLALASALAFGAVGVAHAATTFPMGGGDNDYYVIEVDDGSTYFKEFTVTDDTGTTTTYGFNFQNPVDKATFNTIAGLLEDIIPTTVTDRYIIVLGDTGTYDFTVPNGVGGTISFSVTPDASAHRTTDRLTNLAGHISNTYFAGFSGSENGGAIYNSSTDGYNITADFFNNSADNGGAIFNDGTITDIINSTFIGNSASGESRGGGAIFNDGTITDITNSTFTGNSASGENGGGGAINNYGRITDITNSTFTGNSAGVYGGAIYTEFGTTIGSISATFTGNWAGERGGAIYNDGTITDITSSTFTGNSADVYGGAIYNDGTITDITNSTFTGNWAGESGGAIYNKGTITDITNSTFTGNSAFYGGAIHNSNGNEIGSITNSTFTGNWVVGTFGGAIQNDGTITDITKSTFTGNSASAGGAINNTGTITDITNSTFTGNWADDGGAINNTDTITSITNSTFTGNWADDGGAINNTDTITSITNSTFTGNWADDYGGGAIYNYDTITSITNSTFTGNWAGESGGAIYTRSSLTFTADGGDYSISGNYVSSDGGATKNYNAIYLDAADLSLTFNLKNDGSYTLDDNVKTNGSNTYTFNIIGSGTGDNVFNLNNTLYNAETVTVNNATLNLGAGAYGSGSIEDADLHIISNGEVKFNADVAFAGAVNIGDDSTSGTLTLVADKDITIENGGSLTLHDGTLALSGTGALTIQSGGTANFYTDISLSNNFTNSGTTTFKGTTTLGTVTNSGTIIADGASFTNEYTAGGTTTALNNVAFNGGYESAGILNIGNNSTAGAVTLAADKNMTIEDGGTLNVNDGSLTLSGTGALTIQSGGTANFYTDISLSNIFTNSGTTTFKGTTTLGSVTNNNTIIADGATFTNKYTAGGTTTVLNNVAFNGGYESVGILNIGNDSTAGTLTLAAGKSMDIASGGSFNLLNGSADLSDGTLKVAADAASFSTASDTTLTVKGADFGTFTGLGKFTQNTDIAKKLENDGHLVLVGVDLGTIDNTTYDMLLAHILSTAVSGGTVQFGTTTTVDMYSLSNVQDGYGQNAAIMAGNLASSKEVRVSHIIVDDTDSLNLITASNIADGAELTLTGAANTVLLDTGSLENSGTLNLGVAGASYASNFNGTLTTMGTGETTVLSETTFNQAVSNAGTFTAEATSTFKDDFTSSGTSTFNNEATFTQDLNISGASTNFYGATIVGDDIDITGGVTTFHDSLSVNNVVEVGAGTLEVHAGMTMLGETVNSESAKFDIQSGGTFNLVGGNVDLSDVTFSTADSSTLESAFGTELTVGIATIGVDKDGKTSGSATVNAGTTVTDLRGTVKITGFDTTFTLYDSGTGTLDADYVALNQAATDAYGTDANIIFDGVTFNTAGLTLTLVADNNLSGLGESSVDSGSVDSGETATVGSIRDADASGVSATNNGGTLTITGQSTEIGQENKISAGDVVTSNSGITNLGNGSAISTVGGSVVSDNTTTTNSTTTLFNVNVQENLENTGSGKTVVRGNTSVQGATTLNANAELKAQDDTFTAVGTTTLNGGTLRTTSTASGNDFASASAAFLHNLPNIDGNIIVEQNAYTVLGGGNRAYAEDIYGNSGHDWGTGVTAALFIVKPQTLASGGSIMVDGKSTGIGAAGNNEAKFTANSLLVVDATGVGASAALASTDGKLTVASGAKLVISGGDVGTVTVVSGFTTASDTAIADNAWGFNDATLDNVKTVNATLKIDSVLWDGGKFTVNLVQNAFVLDGVDASVSNFMDAAREAGVSGAFFDFMDNTNNSDVQRVKASETMPQAATIANVSRGTMNATSAAAGAIGLRNNVGGIGTHKPAAVVVNNNKSTKEQSLNGGSDMQSSKYGKSGVGLWLMPLYKWSNVSGIESGVLDGGYETGLGGLTLGADYTFENNFRLGFAFNLGAGYTKSTGDFSGTDNDFDFYGVSLYAGYSYENLNISADVGYTASTHDVTQKMGAASYKAEIFADAWTVGLGASYTFKTDFMDITPHAGVRYLGVTTYGYDIAGLEMDSDFQGVWYFPVGVTLSKDIVTGSGWTFTPKLDLGFIAAAGDLEANSTAGIAGVNAFIQKETTNVDGFAFNGGLGFELANEESGVSFGLNYNLQASEHETAHMINATFRFDF